MRKYLRVALAAVCLVLMAACGSVAQTSPTQSATVAPTNADTMMQKQTIEGLTIVLEAPAAPKLLDSANFVVTLTDVSGKPVEGADVYLELLMPSMPMGTNKPVASADGPGVYRAQGAFDMTGEWHVTVHATVAGKDHAALFLSKVAEKT